MGYRDRDKQLEAQRKHYQENKERYRANQVKRRKKYRKTFIEYLKTLECAACGDSHPSILEFHHKDPATKSYEIGKKSGSSTLETLMPEIEKCIVLCANCHRRLHWEK